MKEKTNTSSIKSIAQALGLSAGTVSIVLNGRGDKMRISQATQKKVMDYAQGINYQPNIYARRLRKVNKNRNLPMIAVFWPVNFNSTLTGRFFNGVQEFQLTDRREAEIVLQPYKYNELEKSAEYLSSEYYSGIILMGLSETDVSFVLANTFDIPIVLLNRPSDQYSSACVDDFESGAKVAELFFKRGHKDVALISYGASSRSTVLKRSGFLSTCFEHGIHVDFNRVVDGEGSYRGGAMAAEELIQRCGSNLPTAVFVLESCMAIGALPVFKKHGIEIPRDMEIVSYGDNPQDEFSIPSLTSIHMPLEEMSKDCMKIIFDILNGDVKQHVTLMQSISIVFRESCGDFNGSFLK